MEIDERILDAVRHTEILRPPKQTLSTFGVTNIYYYLPSQYIPNWITVTETVVREGRVIAQRPRVVTPYYLTALKDSVPMLAVTLRPYFKHMVQMRQAFSIPIRTNLKK